MSFSAQTKVFTKNEEISLLIQIMEARQSLCMCIYCFLNDLRNLVYQVARKENKPYPKSWNKNQQAKSEWLEKFMIRHSKNINEITHYSSIPICTPGIDIFSTEKPLLKEIFTFQEEQALLTYIEIIKKGCLCRKCIINEVTVEAYKIISKMGRFYPKSWDTNKRVKLDWLKGFEERHRSEMYKYSSICEVELSQMVSQQQDPFSRLKEIFTRKEERTLMEKIYVMTKTRQIDCDCISCILKELKLQIYKAACEQKKTYPESWDKTQRAEGEWLVEFVKRHSYEFYNCSCICKYQYLE